MQGKIAKKYGMKKAGAIQAAGPGGNRRRPGGPVRGYSEERRRRQLTQRPPSNGGRTLRNSQEAIMISSNPNPAGLAPQELQWLNSWLLEFDQKWEEGAPDARVAG